MMSDKDIFKYYQYQRNDGYGREAIEVLAKINKVSEDEIKDILRKQGMIITDRKEEKPMGTMNQAELRTAMIKDYNEGMNYKEIAERYQVNPHTVGANFFNWSKKGWVTLRTKMEKPVHKPKVMTEEQPETKTEQVVKILEGKDEQSEPKIKFDTALDRLKALTAFAQLIAEFAGKNVEITGVYACNESSQCDCEMNLDGIRYILQMKRAKE
ncbi:MAG: hypothetical protein IJZ65_10130 [Ruminiclostridium sp.]|nr:hypothetical protein [Ruminiclostridium sp.]MBQ8932000.1 hypothetical protein [Ruminiclostridium sp.]